MQISKCKITMQNVKINRIKQAQHATIILHFDPVRNFIAHTDVGRKAEKQKIGLAVTQRYLYF